MADREKLLQALKNADAAASQGDESAAEDARKLAAMLANMDNKTATDQPQGDPRTSYAGGLAQQFLSGAAFQGGDEAMAGIANTYMGLYDMLAKTPLGESMGLTGPSDITGQSLTAGEGYQTALSDIRADMEDFERRNPGSALTANIAGGLTTGIAAPLKLLPKAPTTLKQIAGVAGVEGLLHGIGGGEGIEDRIRGGLLEGGLSAILGPLGKIGLDKITRRLYKPEATRLREALDPTMDVDAVKAKAQEFYKVADDSGFQVKPESYAKFKNELEALFEQRAIDAKRYPRLGKAIARIRALENPNYQQLQSIKDMLEGALKTGDDSAQRMYAGAITKGVDNFIDQLGPQDVTGGSIKDVAKSLEQGRNLWRRMNQGKLLEDLEYRARLSEAELDLDNFDKALRQQIRPTLLNPRKRVQFDEDVLTDMEGIITGDATKNILRSGARLSPSESTARGFLPALGSATVGITATGSGYGSLLGAIPGLGGGIARKLANRITAKEFDRLKTAVLNEGQLEVNQVLYELMKKHDLLRGSVSAGVAAETGSELGDIIAGQ